MRSFFKSISVFEWIMWCASTVCATVCFFAFGNTNYHYLIGAVIGFTMLIFMAKGNPFGQILSIVFSVFYGIISYSFKYYGEMITYLGMTAPMAVFVLITWLKNPYNGNRTEVKVGTLTKLEKILFVVISAVVTVAFFFILRALGTANLLVSTLSVLTSFMAVFLSSRRSRFYAVCYALNDIVLITLWSMASSEDIMYLPMVVCFSAFLIMDIYGFVNWGRIRKRQSENTQTLHELSS